MEFFLNSTRWTEDGFKWLFVYEEYEEYNFLRQAYAQFSPNFQLTYIWNFLAINNNRSIKQ